MTTRLSGQEWVESLRKEQGSGTGRPGSAWPHVLVVPAVYQVTRRNEEAIMSTAHTTVGSPIGELTLVADDGRLTGKRGSGMCHSRTV